MDGWALGKSKVFLKYYHIEFLSKLYEDQVRKIVLVQAFVRRWLAKVIFKKLKKEKELSALTLQKHVRGWLTRRRFQLLREKQIREKIELERQGRRNENILNNQFVSRSALLKKLSSEEQGFDKENRAAMVIQTYFRGYSLRKQKFSPEMEAKIKIILNTASSRTEATKLLQREKFRDEDIVRILQKYYRRGSRESMQYLSPSEKQVSRVTTPSRIDTPSSNGGSPSRRSMSARDQQMELVGFAQNIHILNQEVHKNLRLNKAGIPISQISALPQDYKRPPGFSLIPSLLGSNHHVLNLIKTNGKVYQSFDELSR